MPYHKCIILVREKNVLECFLRKNRREAAKIFRVEEIFGRKQLRKIFQSEIKNHTMWSLFVEDELSGFHDE